MSFADKVVLYLISFAVFLVIDFIWLGWVAKDFYSTHLGELMAEEVNWTSAIIFYLLFVAGLLIFVIIPTLESGSLLQAIILGAFFGVIAYGTYDLTNLATLKDWSLLVTVIDLIWGGALSAAVATAGYLVGNYLYF